MGQIQSLSELLGLLIRRRLLIGAVAVAVTVLAVIYALSRPVIYQATAVIQVETPTIADATGQPVPSNAAQRLQAIQQRLTTREAMLAVIDRHSLYTELPVTNDEKVHMLRLALRFSPVDSVASPAYGAPPAVSALLITADADTAEKAARIANDFAQGVVDASAEGQTSRARDALLFFREEEARLQTEIRALEDEIAAFKNANAAAVPGVGDLRREELLGVEADLRRIEQDLVALTNERDRLVAEASGRETSRRQIATLGTQIDTLAAQRAALLAEREGLTAELALGPEIERTLAGYDRRMDQLQGQFDIVTRRITEAETARKLEERQQAERFTLLERAVSPDYPITGGRKRLALMGAVASLFIGFGVAFLADLLHPVVRTQAQMQRQLDLRPVVAIPELRGLRPPRGGPANLRAAMLSDGPFGGMGARLAEVPRPLLAVGGLILLVLILAVLG
jgi:uncharacterized protein involved in exopolysaccharide biosynthesis